MFKTLVACVMLAGGTLMITGCRTDDRTTTTDPVTTPVTTTTQDPAMQSDPALTIDPMATPATTPGTVSTEPAGTVAGQPDVDVVPVTPEGAAATPVQ